VNDINFIKIKVQDEYKDLDTLIKEDKEKGIDNKMLIGKREMLSQVLFWIDQMTDKNWNKEAIIFNYIGKKLVDKINELEGVDGSELILRDHIIEELNNLNKELC
jgi:hypothetical protein